MTLGVKQRRVTPGRWIAASLVLAAIVMGAWIPGADADVYTDIEEGLDSIDYVIEEGDTLRLIATRYYSAPNAAAAIFTRNERVFKAAYEKNIQKNPKFDTLNNPFGPQIIYPATTIELPTVLRSLSGVYYDRRDKPLRRELAVVMAKRKAMDMTVLREAAKYDAPPAFKPPPPPSPIGEHAAVKTKDNAIAREPVPRWYKSPSTDLQKCGRVVCDTFKSLCYFECLVVAKRLADGEVSCKSLPAELPYEFETGNQERCKALSL